ncbi:VanZ family protein [Evansella sp. AB-P1]|uniref:VanZ family protein n=1 Tax=Evansella sp. AB-P1 TaxID=3037653 RepID=UPI00241DD9C4|nr:VanZ family protein [Evansella sp. AB-P1]MDG5786709.1 VanZ family protein [Evansella sp. AB-P1]
MSKLVMFYIVPLVVWVGLIYFSSSQPYERQNVQPILQEFDLEWVETVGSNVSFKYGDSIISLQYRDPAAFIEFFIRKGAHLFVFAVLGILAYRLAYILIEKRMKSAIIAWLFVTIYASIDEFSQLLHPNRSGMIEDVILDSVGGIIGVGIIILWRRRNNRFKVEEK